MYETPIVAVRLARAVAVASIFKYHQRKREERGFVIGGSRGLRTIGDRPLDAW